MAAELTCPRRGLAAVLVGLIAGLLLAVMPPTSPAHAGETEDRAAREVATARCEQIIQAIVVLPRQWKESCATKLAADLVSGAEMTGVALKLTCKRWVPDLPLVGDPCNLLVSLLKGVKAAFEKRVEELAALANAVLNPFDTLLVNMVESLGRGLNSLLGKVISEMVHLTSPNLQSQSFLSTYAAGAGIGIFVLVFMIARVFYKASAGDMSGEELAESLWRWVPTAMLLVVFGPGIGYLVVRLTEAATTSIILYFAKDVASLGLKFQRMAVLDNTPPIPGGPIVALVVMALAFLGGVGLIAGLVVQLLALYMSGAVMAIAFVATVDPATRPKALKLPVTWVGLLWVKPLLFFMVGGTARFADSAFTLKAFADDGMRALVTAVVAAVALLFLGVAPWSLLKYAPVLPSGSAERVGKASRSQNGGTLGNLASSTMMALSYRRMQGSPAGGGGGGGGTEAPPSGPGSQNGSPAANSQQRTPQETKGNTEGRPKAESTTAKSAGQTATSPSSGGGTSASADSGALTAKAPGPDGAASGGGRTPVPANGGNSPAVTGGTQAATKTGAAGAGAAAGGVAAAALIGVQAASAGKRKVDDAANRAGDTVGE